MTEFLAMGGYAAYVWSAFGLTFAVLLANAIIAFRSHRRTVRSLRGAQGGNPQ